MSLRSVASPRATDPNRTTLATPSAAKASAARRASAMVGAAVVVISRRLAAGTHEARAGLGATAWSGLPGRSSGVCLARATTPQGPTVGDLIERLVDVTTRYSSLISVMLASFEIGLEGPWVRTIGYGSA